MAETSQREITTVWIWFALRSILRGLSTPLNLVNPWGFFPALAGFRPDVGSEGKSPGAMSTKKKTKKTKKTRSTKQTVYQAQQLETIAKTMDEIARKRLPDGVIECGVLKGREAEIRQEALIMSVGGFLQENAGYIDALKIHDDDAIQTSMEKCLAIALSIAKRRIASRLTHELARTTQLTEENGGTYQHPAQREPSDLPIDVKAVVVMRSVFKAVHQGKLSIPNALIMHMICERGMGVHDVAIVAGITKSAIYQQIWRIKRVLPEVMEEVEIHLP